MCVVNFCKIFLFLFKEANVAISKAQETGILKIFAGLFNAAPGGNNLTTLANLVEGGVTLSQLADGLAATNIFKQVIMGGKVTIDEQVDVLMNNFGLTSSNSAVRAVAQAEAFFIAQIDAGVGFGAIIYRAMIYLSGAVSPAFSETANLFDNKALVAEAYSRNSSSDDLSVLQNVLSTVTGTAPFTQLDIDQVMAGSGSDPIDSTVGQTFTLTTGVDIIAGTSGNDIINADNTGTVKQLSVADRIDGVGGTEDTLKVLLATTDTATGQPTLNNIDNVWINGGGVTTYTAATGTAGLIIEAPVLTGGALPAATYTIAGQAVTLKDANVTVNSITTIASATDTAQSVTLNNWTSTGTVTNTVDISGTNVTALNLSGTGTDTTPNQISLTNTGTALTTLNIAGDKRTSVTENTATAAAITTIAVSNTAGVMVDTSAGAVAATFNFTGDAGEDTIILADNALAALTVGTQLDGGAGTADKIGINDTVLTATESTRINQATGFEVLGLNAAIAVDASTLTTIKDFSIDVTGLAQSINDMATGSTVTINDVSPTSLTLDTGVGVTDTSIVLGTATSAGITVGTLVATGITNVALVSNGTAVNAITTLTNSDSSVFTITGDQDLTLALSAGAALGSQIDASTFTGKGTFTGSDIASSGDMLIGGSGIDTINGLAGADVLTGNSGADIFTFTSTAAANTSGAAFGQADVIADFVVGIDKLQFSTIEVVSGQQAAVQTTVTALAAGSTASQVAAEMAATNTTDQGVSIAVFEDNSYVLYETSGAGAGVAADDVFIQLAGVVTTPTFATDVIA